MKHFAALIAVLLLNAASPAVAGDPVHRTEIVTVVSAQLDALARNDGDAAFAKAAPQIRALFGSPARFMAMVARGYAPLLRPRAVTFLDLTDGPQGPVLRVLLTGAGGEQVTALYTMLRLEDGSWRIAGCALLRQEGGSA